MNALNILIGLGVCLLFLGAVLGLVIHLTDDTRGQMNPRDYEDDGPKGAA